MASNRRTPVSPLVSLASRRQRPSGPPDCGQPCRSSNTRFKKPAPYSSHRCSMYDRFPQLRQIQRGRHPMTVFWTAFSSRHICIAIYVAGFGLPYVDGSSLRGSTAHSCILFGTTTAIVVWAIMVPGSLWTMLIPTPWPGVAARIPCLHVYVVCQSRSQKLLL